MGMAGHSFDGARGRCRAGRGGRLKGGDAARSSWSHRPDEAACRGGHDVRSSSADTVTSTALEVVAEPWSVLWCAGQAMVPWEVYSASLP